MLRACWVVGALFVGSVFAAGQKGLVGLTRDQVIARLGEPKSTMAAGSREVLLYNGERLVLRNNVVIEADEIAPDAPPPPPPAPAPAATDTTPPADTTSTTQPATNPTPDNSGATTSSDTSGGGTTTSTTTPTPPPPPPEVQIISVRPPSRTSAAPAAPAAPAPAPVPPTAIAKPAPVPAATTPATTVAPATPAPAAAAPASTAKSAAEPAKSAPAAEPIMTATPSATTSAEPAAPEATPTASAAPAQEKASPPPLPMPLGHSRKHRAGPVIPDAAQSIFTGRTYAIAFVIIIVGVGYIVWRRKQRDLALVATAVSRPPFAASPTIPGSGTRFTIELLNKLEWKRFEELVAAYYNKTGVVATRTKSGPAAPVHIRISWKGEPRPFACVQCIPNPTGLVEVKPIQALCDALASEDIRRGYAVTSGKFSVPARDLAEEKHITLLSGDIFLEKLNALPDTVRAELMRDATVGDNSTPTCPTCDIKMVRAPADPSVWQCAQCGTVLPKA